MTKNYSSIHQLTRELIALVSVMQGADRGGELVLKLTVEHASEAITAELIELRLEATPVVVPSPS